MERKGRFLPQNHGLYDSTYEHDSCGVGFVVNINGQKSHEIVENGIKVLYNLLHRGAVGGDNNTGDGAGILFQLPDEFFRKASGSLGFTLPPAGEYGVGMLFLPEDKRVQKKCVALVERLVEQEKLTLLGWRDVPVDKRVLGKDSAASCPAIKQVFVGMGEKLADLDAFERKLYLVRRQVENAAEAIDGAADSFYVVSMSARVIVYKGLLLAQQIKGFYADLGDPSVKSALALVHQRYSTNTFPTWPLAQPFRFLAHNGEINTLRGNQAQMRAKEKAMRSDLFGEDFKKLLPVIQENGSDSACLDNVLELLVNCGRDLPQSMMMLIPEAWGEKYHIGQDLKGFFEYHAAFMEPWDGPAAVAFSDGRCVGAMLDRNGLRPARYTITKDGFMVFASETGVLDIPPENVKTRGRLGPGQMLFVDLDANRVIFNHEIKNVVARRKPYRRWVEENKITLNGLFEMVSPPQVDEETIRRRQFLFGYTREDLNIIIGPMLETGHEPNGSMGNDAALAVLSEKPQLLFNYFKQLFAQVTNPPIDPIREELVMSLTTFIGNTQDVLDETPQHARLVKLRYPVLTDDELERLRSSKNPDFQSATLKAAFPVGGDGAALRQAVEALCQAAAHAISVDHKSVIVLSDRGLAPGLAPIPSLLAVSAVNQYLTRQGLRTSAGLVLETGEAREVMHFALIFGYGATAVNPYLALESVAHLVKTGMTTKPISPGEAIGNYIKSICKGILKVMSKMGISTLRSYRGAQVFEAIGLDVSLVDEFFAGTSSKIGGIGFPEIAREANARYAKAIACVDPHSLLDDGGLYQYRANGEKHLWTPESLPRLQRACRENDPKLYREYAALINNQERNLCTLRGLFKFKKRAPVPLDEVEPATDIMKRFVTGAMSFGSISKEAHETLAIAMNRIGGMSNSGEGGEDPVRFKPLANGDSLCSAIKQVASGRFGVTIEYLSNAKELQIKIAQGAKPGEGGQLPGHKVDAIIAKVRHSTPGVTLISPPPHHDIYSIEDLAQLIFDLKNANPKARVSVKLVSEVGVGTIAAGVAKGHADMVLISGHDGGTGASPLTSVKHAGSPWELGLAETQQTLVKNNLRSRIRVQADGQMKTGRDVVIGAMLGAEEFGFATTALVVCGCVMMRKCHSNTCPVGVATQDPELRKKFTGKPEHVINFFRFIAEDVRERLAELGFRHLDEAVGRADLLDVNEAIDFWKTKNLDFSKVFAMPDDPSLPVRRTSFQEHGLETALDHELIKEAAPALEQGAKVKIVRRLRNSNRSVGTMLSNAVAVRYGGKGLPDDSVVCEFSGQAGQSFGAFLAHGVTFRLQGEANDYVGKGLSGGRIIVTPEAGSDFDASQNAIAGNVLLYGATSGELYLNGMVGERFAIRNSGAITVAEGVGDHCCEYMTGGRVVVLGPVGVNFGAGMSGGIAYVYDEKQKLDDYCNLDTVDLEAVCSSEDVAELKALLERHHRFTGSAKAAAILADWKNSLPLFVKVFPMEYRKALGRMTKEDEAIERLVMND